MYWLREQNLCGCKNHFIDSKIDIETNKGHVYRVVGILSSINSLGHISLAWIGGPVPKYMRIFQYIYRLISSSESTDPDAAQKNLTHLNFQHPKTADPRVYIFQFISLYKKKTLQSRMLINTFEWVLKVNEFLSSRWDSPSIKLQAHFTFPFKFPIKGASPPKRRRASLWNASTLMRNELTLRKGRRRPALAWCDGLHPRGPSDTYSNCWVLTPTPADEQPARFWPCGVCESMGSW